MRPTGGKKYFEAKGRSEQSLRIGITFNRPPHLPRWAHSAYLAGREYQLRKSVRHLVDDLINYATADNRSDATP